MIKKKLYPKTTRFGLFENTVITEKIDGSNIGFFKLDDELWVAQRNTVYKASESNQIKDQLYKGMYQWLSDNATHLEQNLQPNSGFFGEWLGMGKIGYGDRFDKKVLMFAKCNIDGNMDIKNLYYDHDLFKYPFIGQEIPEYLGKVPIVHTMVGYPTIELLDTIFEEYEESVESLVEGFVLNNNNQILKYVRRKCGTLEPHKPHYKDGE